MTWRRILLLWVAALAIGGASGSILGASSSILYQANLPVGDVYFPLVLASSLVTGFVGAWCGFVAGLFAVAAVALFDRRLRLQALHRNLLIGLASGLGGYVALLLFYSGPSNLESPWTFVGAGVAIAITASVAAAVCGRRAETPGPSSSDS